MRLRWRMSAWLNKPMPNRLDNDVFKAIADPTRRAILDLLRARGEQPVHALAEPFHMSLSALSQHLKVLREAKLVDLRAAGRERFYKVRNAPLKDVEAWVKPFGARR